ncbi:hypothetical protein HDU87_005392 [Geranomyces variabilis]|uniref:Thioredoxin domain-containing protein n=1 Tax=Geranomyces variabilis TaxID=109894 RepID=A0AAD5XPQ9_9FUNG|nr:hypothetical protein HDU87_005392 [Geranomyces variabilis]
MPTTLVPNPAAFPPALSAALAAAAPPNRIYVLLYATEDPATGKSWCPDCVTADPLVAAEFAARPNATLLRVATGDRPTWRDPQNYYRTHPQINAKSVPTLIEWGKDGPIRALVEDQVNDVQGLRKFLDHQ